MFQLEPNSKESLVVPMLALRRESYNPIGTLKERRSMTHNRNRRKTSNNSQKGGLPKTINMRAMVDIPQALACPKALGCPRLSLSLSLSLIRFPS